MPALAEILLMISLPGLMVLSGFFSGCETALFSLTHHQRLKMSRSTRKAEATVAQLLDETRGLLITLLVTNTSVNITYFVLSSVLLIRLRQVYQVPAAVLGGLSLLPVIGLILIGEVMPKLIASRASEVWSRLCSLPLMSIHRGLAPLRGLLSGLVITPLARLISPEDKPPQLSAQELETLLELSLQQGVIDPQEEQLLQEVLELSQLKVRQVMTPRVDIQALNVSDLPADLVRWVINIGHSHIPVFEDNLDHITGIVYTRQVLLKRPRTKGDLAPLVRQVSFVPELQRADQLLLHFRKSGTTVAIVVDEYGGTAGLVTLEDVVEEMVGQIAGPHEPRHEPLVQPIEPGRWRVSAGLSIRDWADAFRSQEGLMALGRQSQVHTLGGWVMALLGRVPKEGDQVTIGNLVVTVETMAGRRVQWLLIRLVEEGLGDPSSVGGRAGKDDAG